MRNSHFFGPGRLAVLFLAAILVQAVPSSVGASSPAPGITGTDSLMVRTHPALTMAYDPWGEILWAAFVNGGVMAMSLDGSSRWILTNVDGLPSNTVYAITPAPDRVWLGTAGGLAAWRRADSTLESAFAIQGASTLKDKIWALHREGDALWVGTDHEGLFRLDNPAGRLIPVDNPINQSRFAHPIRGIAADTRELWISATGYGVVRWDRPSGHAGRWEAPFNLFHDETLNGEVHIVGSDVWVATHGEGVSRFNRTSGYWQTFANPDNLHGYTVNQMSVLGQEVWFAIETGVARYSYTTDRWDHWNADNGFPTYQATAVAIGGGRVYADALFKGISTYDRPSDAWSLLEWEGNDQQPPYNIMEDCVLDGQEIIFGTSGGGAARYNPATGAWTHAYQSGQNGGLPDILVHRVLPDDQEIWFGTEAGPARLDRASGAWSAYRTDGLGPYARVGAPAFDLAKSPDGTLWVATREQGLAVYDEAANRFETYGTGHGLSGQRVWAVVAQGADVWVGTDYAVDRFDPATSRATRVWPIGSNETIFDMAWDGSALWLAAGRGLFRLDPTTGTATPTAVADKVAVRILPSSHGIFVSTYQDGLYLVDPVNGRVRDHFTLQDAARFDIRCLAEHDGILYVGGAWGVERLHLATKRWLPQQGLASALITAPPPPTLEISQPTDGQRVSIGDPVVLRGTARGLPEGAQIEGRLGLKEWVGFGPGPGFTATFPTDDEAEGTGSVLVRAVADGRVVASTAARVQLDWPATRASAQDPAAGSASALGPDGLPVIIRHLPPVEADEGATVEFAVTTDPPLAGALTTLVFEEPTDRPDVELVDQGDGSYQATAGPFPADSSLAYHIVVAWEGGSAHLPAPGDPAGESYPLYVRYAHGFVAFFVPPDTLRFAADIGATTPFKIPVQNTGTRPAQLEVSWDGQAGPWIDSSTTLVEVPAGSTAYVHGNLSVPAGVLARTMKLDLTLQTGTQRQDFPIEVQVGGAAGGGGLTPAPGLPLLLLALGLALAFARAGPIRR